MQFLERHGDLIFNGSEWLNVQEFRDWFDEYSETIPLDDALRITHPDDETVYLLGYKRIHNFINQTIQPFIK